jgi:hypothetical protein
MEPDGVSDDGRVVNYSFKSPTELFAAGNLQRFLKTRRHPKTRFYVALLLLSLSDVKKIDTTSDGWVSATDMRKTLIAADRIPNLSTFYNLIGDLHDAALIEKRTGKKTTLTYGCPPAHYRVPVIYKMSWFTIPADILADHYVANRDAIEHENAEQGIVTFDKIKHWTPSEVSRIVRDREFFHRLTAIRLTNLRQYKSTTPTNGDTQMTS